MKYAKPIILFLALIIISLGIWAIFWFRSFINTISVIQKTSGQKKIKTISDKIANNLPFNILLMGYGGGNHDGAYLTDSMIVAHFDLSKKQVVLISIPRDLWAKLPETETHAKINSVYETDLENDGDLGMMTKTVIKDITGLQIDNFIALDFAGFTKSIDILGGVDVKVAKTFDDYQYPIEGKEKNLCGKDDQFNLISKFITPPYNNDEKLHVLKDHPDLSEYLKNATEEPQLAFPCRYEHLHFDKGLTHMNGETALKYVRSRHSLQDGTDFGRSERQKLLMLAVKDKVLNINFIPKIMPFFESLKNDVKTDLTFDDMKNLLSIKDHISTFKIKSLAITLDNVLTESYSSARQYIIVSNEGIDKWESVHNFIKAGLSESVVSTPSGNKKQ